MTEPTHEQMLAFLQAATKATELWEVSEPHAIVEFDPVTGGQQVHGPYPDAYEAVQACIAWTAYARTVHDEPVPTYRAVLYFDRSEDPEVTSFPRPERTP